MKASVIIFLLVLVSFIAQITKEDAISGTSKIFDISRILLYSRFLGY